MEEADVVRALGALASGVRLRVFRLLVVGGRSGLTPGAIAEQFGLVAPSLSFHLKELVHAGLVTQARDGRHLIYRAAFERMDAVIGYLGANCCQGEACLQVPTTACAAPAARVCGPAPTGSSAGKA